MIILLTSVFHISLAENTFSMASPYSPKDEALRFIQALTGYTPNNSSLPWGALQVAGNGNTPGNKDGNKELALAGDAVIKTHLVIQGLQRHQCRGTRYLSLTCC